ncbi:hypothetical protein MKX01_005860 [Papaver californicum]|nr:hypothetical protein MKX01_005860 [Papaver californicum]
MNAGGSFGHRSFYQDPLRRKDSGGQNAGRKGGKENPDEISPWKQAYRKLRVLDAPGIVNDFYLNLLDWGSRNVIAISLGNTVYLWDASDISTYELMTVDDDIGPITSVSWAPDGRHIAVGFNNSEVQVWDSTSAKKLRTFRGGHQAPVGALNWNSHILSTGGMGGLIINNDVRINRGNDNLLYSWDRSAASSNSHTQWLHMLEDHNAAVKALAWCPFQANILASGGDGNDKCIKFWNSHTIACLNSVETGELSSYGFTEDQLTPWKYPSMVNIVELTGRTLRVLFTTHIPDGCTVASAAGDEILRFWNVFGYP